MAIGARRSGHLLLRMGQLAVPLRATGVGDAMPGVVTGAAVLRDRLARLRVSGPRVSGGDAPRHECGPLLRLRPLAQQDQSNDQEDRYERELGQPLAAKPVGIEVVDFRGAPPAAASRPYREDSR